MVKKNLNRTHIAMWSGPRNISTALMRSFENRSDTFVSDEPLYAHYLKQTGVVHPLREKIIKSNNTNLVEVSEYLTGEVPEGKRFWFQKHMAQHILPGMDMGWVKKLINCFLIRDPKDVILSYSMKYDIASVDQLGFHQQFQLFQRIFENSGMIPIVLDAKDILTNPEKILKKFCVITEIPFKTAMLSWPSGKRDSDGVWGKHWYNSVEKSTRFQSYSQKTEGLPQNYKLFYKECLVYYKHLFQHRI